MACHVFLNCLFQGEMFVPYSFETPRSLHRGDHMCESPYKKEIVIVDERGKHFED